VGEIFSTYTVIGESMGASSNSKMYRAVLGYFVPLRTFFSCKLTVVLLHCRKKQPTENLRFVCTRSLSKVAYLRKSLNTYSLL